MSSLWFWVTFMTLIGAGAATKEGAAEYKFVDVTSIIAERQLDLSKHKFFGMLADTTLSYEKRMSFIPYLIFYTMSFADLLDSWMFIPNPSSEMEKFVNTFIDEDDYHYNFYLEDNAVLGYNIDRFGTYPAVVRHIWSDETKTIRQLMYTWVLYAKKFEDPLLVLVTMETFEAGVHDLFVKACENVHRPKDGIKALKYFGDYHVALESNHSQAASSKPKEDETESIDNLDVSALQFEQSMEVIEAVFEGYVWQI
jgi:hypothetical protein